MRRLVIGRRPILVAWLLGWVDIVRRPLRVVPTAVFGTLVLALLTVPGLLAAASGWARVRDVMTHPDDAAGMLLTVSIWVAVWLGGLVLAGVGRGDSRGRLDARSDPAGHAAGAARSGGRAAGLSVAPERHGARGHRVLCVLRFGRTSLLDCCSPRAPGRVKPDGGRIPAYGRHSQHDR